MRSAIRLILNAVSLAANLLAGICVAFYVFVLVSTPSDIEWPDSEGPAMLSGISASFALILLPTAAVLAVICIFVSRERMASSWSSGQASLIVSLILGSIFGAVLFYINFLA